MVWNAVTRGVHRFLCLVTNPSPISKIHFSGRENAKEIITDNEKHMWNASHDFLIRKKSLRNRINTITRTVHLRYSRTHTHTRLIYWFGVPPPPRSTFATTAAGLGAHSSERAVKPEERATWMDGRGSVMEKPHRTHVYLNSRIWEYVFNASSTEKRTLMTSYT